MSVTETEEKPVNVTDTTSSDAASAGSSPAEDSSEKKTRTTARKKASSKEEGAVAEEKPKRQRRVRSSAKTIEETPSEEAKKSTFKTGEKAESASKDASAEGTKAEESETDSSQKNQQRKQRSSKKSGTSQKNSSSQKNSHRRSRRQHGGSSRREPVVPQTNREDLEKLKVVELRAKAAELGVESKGLKKAELVEVVLGAAVKAEGFVETEGILDILSDGYGFLRTKGYLPSEGDVYVGLSTIRRNGLRKGDFITGQVRPPRDNEKYAALQRIDTVNGIALEELGKRVRFADLTPVFPDERLVLEHGKNTITARVIDLCAPIGKGQRGLIVSPPKAGKTTILKDIAAAITANNPEVHLMCLLVDERPEEVTDMERSIRGEVISSTFDMPCENHVAVSEMVIERAKRLVETGKDVVILLDSLTRLARAYNLAQPASGRILSGGVDSSVAAVLLSKAIGKNLTCIFVDHGLLRKNEGDEVEKIFREQYDINLIRVNAEDRFLAKLSGVTDPEQKRKIIGEEFIRVFEEESKKIGTVDFLVQGTIYPDVIESGLGKSSVIKSHHNVGGLPDYVDFKEIVEPLRNLFKDEVRKVGLELGIPENLVFRQPFPGPGLAIRVIGDITKDKLDILRDADFIFRDEIAKAGLHKSINQYFAVLTNLRSVGVMGDERTYDYTLALRAVETTDFMTGIWSKIPYEILEKVSSRIVNEVKHINRVVYDITSKPPATIEWE